MKRQSENIRKELNSSNVTINFQQFVLEITFATIWQPRETLFIYKYATFWPPYAENVVSLFCFLYVACKNKFINASDSS